MPPVPFVPPMTLPPLPGLPPVLPDIEPPAPPEPFELPPTPPAPLVAVPPLPPGLPPVLAGASDGTAPSGKDPVVDFPQPLKARNMLVATQIGT